MEDIKMLEKILTKCVEKKLTPLVWGKHGIGKSMIVRKLFESKGYEVIDLRLGQLEVGDLIGVPAQEFYCPVCDTKFGFSTREAYCPICALKEQKIPIAGRTVWLPPSWFPQNGEKRLLFFDELNRGRLDVQQACFQIVLDRRIHTHKIPDNCGIVCACNPSGGDYFVEELDPALLDRFVNIKFNLDTRQWLKWARDNGINQDIINFIAVDSKYLGNESIKMEINVTPSPRSYEFLSKLLDGEPKNHSYWSEVSTCIIGESASLAFIQSLKADIEKPIKASEIFNKWDKVKDRVKEQVEAGNSDVGTRYDLLKITLDEIYDSVKDGKSKKLTQDQLDNLGNFLLAIPEDLSFSALKDLAPIEDINTRLLMNDKGKKLFEILKKARKDDMR